MTTIEGETGTLQALFCAFLVDEVVELLLLHFQRLNLELLGFVQVDEAADPPVRQEFHVLNPGELDSFTPRGDGLVVDGGFHLGSIGVVPCASLHRFHLEGAIILL